MKKIVPLIVLSFFYSSSFSQTILQGEIAEVSTNGKFYPGTYQNNIDANPRLTSPSAGSGTSFNGVIANRKLQDGSPAINTGEPGAGYPALDYAGNTRVVNGIIDIGATENQTSIPPTAIVSGGGLVCLGDPLPSVVFTFTYGTLPFTLQYSINGVLQTPVAGITNLQYTIAHAAPGVYTIAFIKDALTTGTGTGSATVTIVQTVPGFTINNERQCLQGNSFIFSNTSVINTGSLTYKWNFGDGSSLVTDTNPTHVYTLAGIHLVTLMVADTAGCVETLTRMLTVTRFTINTMQDTAKTYLESLVLNAGSGFSSYLWSTGDTSQNITVKDSRWYYVTVFNSEGCSAKDSSYVNFRKNRTLFIDRKQNLCSVSSFDLSIRTKNITNVVGLQGTISWDQNTIQLDSVKYDHSALAVTAADLNLSNKANGYLTYLWNDNSLAGKSVTDSTRIFTLKFSKIKAGNAVTVLVVFSSSHTLLEIDTISLSTHALVVATEMAYVNGFAAFRKSPAVSSIVLAACDSVVYNNTVYYDSAVVLDTIKYSGSPCDSMYKTCYINIYHAFVPEIYIKVSSNTISYGVAVTFSAGMVFAGTSPLLQWYKNGTPIPGQNGNTYASSTLHAGDTIYVVLKSSYSCSVPDSVISDKIGMNVNYSISGNIKSPTGAFVRNPEIDVTGFTNQLYTGGSTGNYAFVLPGGISHNYVMKPFKLNDVNKMNGVSTLDVAIIQSHILNTTLFNSPYQWIAADVNKSNTVTSIDIIFIKRFILGLDNRFQGNRIWEFVDTANGAINTLHPLPFKDSITFINLLTNKSNINFIGVKLGDVNFDWNSAVARPAQVSSNDVVFYYDDERVKAGAEIRVPIRIKNFKRVLGMQFTLNFNSSILQLKKIENNPLGIQYTMHRSNEGKLAFIWNDANNNLSSLNDGDVLFELVFTQKAAFDEEDISITSDMAAVELRDGDYHKHNIVKGAGKIINAAENYINYTTESWFVTPNPSHGVVQLNLQLLLKRYASIKLFNAEGKTVMTQNRYFPKGISTAWINLEKNNILSAGTYYMSIHGMGENSVKKIVLIK